jgi:hypothetical protein
MVQLIRAAGVMYGAESCMKAINQCAIAADAEDALDFIIKRNRVAGFELYEAKKADTENEEMMMYYPVTLTEEFIAKNPITVGFSELSARKTA